MCESTLGGLHGDFVTIMMGELNETQYCSGKKKKKCRPGLCTESKCFWHQQLESSFFSNIEFKWHTTMTNKISCRHWFSTDTENVFASLKFISELECLIYMCLHVKLKWLSCIFFNISCLNSAIIPILSNHSEGT